MDIEIVSNVYIQEPQTVRYICRHTYITLIDATIHRSVCYYFKISIKMLSFKTDFHSGYRATKFMVVNV